MEQFITNQDADITFKLHDDYYLPDFASKEPPKIFWKYYDLYRRGVMAFDEYVDVTGISASLLSLYLLQV